MRPPPFARLARAQHGAPWRWLAASFAVALLALPRVIGLPLDSDFLALLPEDAPSVRDLDEIRSRFGGTATLTLALTADGDAELAETRELVRALVPRIEAMHDEGVTSVDWTLADVTSFIEEHRWLYAELDDLRELERTLRARIDHEHAIRNPLYVDLGGSRPDPRAVIQRMRARGEEARGELARFPEGFYQHPREPTLLVFVRTDIRGGEVTRTEALIAAIESAVDAVHHAPARARSVAGGRAGYVAPGLRIDYGGDLMDVREETAALAESVARSTIVTLVLLALVIQLFFFRVRAIALLGLVLVPPVLVTFAVGREAVTALNASTAFLGSIIVGNGVNAAIVWLARYFEERRNGRDVPEALENAHEGTWVPTLAAASAAALSYGSLTITQFRGFRDFGALGAVGMLLCWVAAYLVLPPLVVVSERVRPLVLGEAERVRAGLYGRLASRLALPRPRLVLILASLVTLGMVAALASRGTDDIIDYDFRRLQAERDPESRVFAVNQWVGETIDETRRGSAIALLAPRSEDVAPLRTRLGEIARAHPDAIGAVRGLDDLVPADQDAKLEVLVSLRAALDHARPWLEPRDREALDAELSSAAMLTRIELGDLPPGVARPFTERDGTRGRLLFVEPAPGASGWDGRYLIQWAEAARAARTDDGRAPVAAGTAVVFADLLAAIYRDGARALAASLVATLVLLLLAFRGRRERLLSVAALTLGVVWMAGALALCDERLNFLNLVAFPITFGIGADYVVNVLRRIDEEAEARGTEGAARRALEGAGGAVVLCSLTTMIGYLSLFASTNRAINSFGLAMTVSELACLAAAVLVVPAWIEARVTRRPAS